ncbi:hypothetical protein [Oharaeibacter diazotrophicus]|uniref:GpW protein n=1 Tax=Oharaeibacter diazotrophicus TaxID=1920512 RepID=A0A4R6RGB9_9HYPH|nr:hypothetical protein [Oharaeibacter diazotrophicus]TDP85383.1 hypothetical protein EDD54_2236 [Oharaeibacter diazotrophicus]BBE74353.1 hypothetical protein OHA_1_03984 [Pleomorphomonas sp. SM30]GLS75954.1 hypothetical protein GCM10007904_12890 [Oharaeibacter diazotrophicus]
MPRTVEEIDADIAALEAARRARVSGTQVVSSTFPDAGSVTFATTSLGEINRELARLRMERAGASGEASGLGPILPGFGARA